MIRSYTSSDFEAWLDLTALSSISFLESHYIWNQRPDLSSRSISYLYLTDSGSLTASVDLEPLDEDASALEVKLWFLESSKRSQDFKALLEYVLQLHRKRLLVWVGCLEIQKLLQEIGAQRIDQRTLFFVNPHKNQFDDLEGLFMDHVYSSCHPKDFNKIRESVEIVDKTPLQPINHDLFEIPWNRPLN